MEPETLLSTQAAGDWLHVAMSDKSSTYWQQALINNRRADRNPPHRIPFTQIGRGAFYTEADLQAFSEFEKSRRVGAIKLSSRTAEAMRAFGGTTQGRPFKGGSASPQVANNNAGVFVQTVINEPLMIFAMTPGQAIEFGADLLEAGQTAQRMSSDAVQNQPDLSRYEAITNNQEIKIMRKTKS